MDLLHPPHCQVHLERAALALLPRCPVAGDVVSAERVSFHGIAYRPAAEPQVWLFSLSDVLLGSCYILPTASFVSQFSY
jgi:hypothetical protein